MTSPETVFMRNVVAGVLTRRIGSGADAPAVAAAAGLAWGDLSAVLGPLISQAGVDALLARALQVAQREYPPIEPSGEEQAAELSAEPSGQFSRWLERQDPRVATDAAVTVFAILAATLATLVGEPLTMRYLKKAWPDGFSDRGPRGTRA